MLKKYSLFIEFVLIFSLNLCAMDKDIFSFYPCTKNAKSAVKKALEEEQEAFADSYEDSQNTVPHKDIIAVLEGTSSIPIPPLRNIVLGYYGPYWILYKQLSIKAPEGKYWNSIFYMSLLEYNPYNNDTVSISFTSGCPRDKRAFKDNDAHDHSIAFWSFKLAQFALPDYKFSNFMSSGNIFTEIFDRDAYPKDPSCDHFIHRCYDGRCMKADLVCYSKDRSLRVSVRRPPDCQWSDMMSRQEARVLSIDIHTNSDNQEANCFGAPNSPSACIIQ